MKVKMIMKDERLKFVMEAFPKAIVSKREDGWNDVEFEINHDWDALSLFHAGCMCGTKEAIEHFNKPKTA
jgi:hypothetical protein